MTSTMSVRAQWALEGKQPDGEDYRILACSTGDLDRANFADALDRFQLGELNTLPQVSVSYARHGTQPGLSYLALAIHWYAAEGQCYADGVAPRDDVGRPTAYTNYFCLPYQDMAPLAVGYVAMYEGLSAVTLTVADGPPLPVMVATPTSRTPAVNDLAVRVAPLLLTGQPVCVLGADGTGMLERLRFIDTVMDLLPYGFRSRMTAATWTRATNRNHRFRLFFSSSPRTDAADHVVNWGEDPDLVPAPDKEAGEYFDWLQDSLAPLARLAELTGEMGFGRKDIIQALEAALGARHRFHSRRPAVRASTGKPGQPPQQVPVPGDAGEEVLRGCAEHAKLANPTRLRSDIAFLKKFAEGEISEGSRTRYQNLIARLGLLRHDFSVKERVGERLYGALLPVAFGTPIGYPAYCRMEKCAGIAPGKVPRKELLAAILGAEMTPEVSAIVHWHLAQTDERALNKWLVSGEVDVVELINLLAGGCLHPQHGRMACDVTLKFLEKAPKKYEPQEIRLALRQHGFLAHALQIRHPDKDQYQVYALHQFLKAAYPQVAATPGRDLSPTAILQILTGTGAPPPTPALLSAVLSLLDKPEDWQLAFNAYICGSLTLPKFSDATLARLRPRVPHIDAASINAPQLRPEEDPARSGGDMTGHIANGPP